MGLDAHVYCNCLAQGRTKPLPKGVSIQLEDGYYCMYSHGVELSTDEVDAYLEHACEHPNMLLFSDRLGNISGLNRFAYTLDSCGKHFPTLATLFNVGSCIPYERVLVANEELQTLKRLLPTLEGNFLTDLKTNATVSYTIGNTELTTYLCGEQYSTLHDGKYNILETNTHQTLFSSGYYTFYPHSGLNTFEDVVSGTSFNTPLGFGYLIDYPRQFRVEYRHFRCEDVHTLSILQECFNASIESKNPIWYG
jgi:hypothetical protein